MMSKFLSFPNLSKLPTNVILFSIFLTSWLLKISKSTALGNIEYFENGFLNSFLINSFKNIIFTVTPSFYSGPEIPCLRIITKCVSIRTAATTGNTKVCAL